MQIKLKTDKMETQEEKLFKWLNETREIKEAIRDIITNNDIGIISWDEMREQIINQLKLKL